ncbi:MAG: hypothetical protein ABSC77_14875 [Terracidiphilus sp.]
MKGAIDCVPRLVNVPERALLQTYMSSLIGPAGNVPARVIQKSQCRTQGTIGVSPGWRGSEVGISSLIANRCPYFIDGAVNFTDSAIPLADESRAIVRLQQRARFPEVGKSMEIMGALGLSRRSQSKKQESRQTENGRGK